MVGEARGTEGQLRGEGGAISASRLNNALIVKLQSESGGRGEVDAQIISRTCLKVCTCTCTVTKFPYTYMYMHLISGIL